MTFKETIKIVLGWRLIIVLIAIPAMFFVSPRLRFANITNLPSSANLYTMWANFDGTHYLRLAEFGYAYQYKTVTDYSFFPTFPWIVRTFNVFDNYLTSSLVLSHLFLVLSLYFLYRLVELDFKAKIARSTIQLLLIFPTSFFFGSVYPESLLLLFAVLTFYFYRKDRLLLACISAAAASVTGAMGIFLWPALVYEYWLSHDRDTRKSLNLPALWLILPPLSLAIFLRFQFIKVGEKMFLATLMSTFLGQAVDKFILIYQVFFRYAKMLLLTDHFDPLFFTITLEVFCATLVALVLIFSFRKIRFSYWLFALLSYVLPSFSGSFMGFPRYTLVLFPVFIFLALWLERQHPFVKIAYYILSAVATIFAISLFTRGYFVG